MCTFIKKIHLLFIIFCACAANAQEFIPLVTQFSKNDYRAANQNWAVAQGLDGILYFGNNEGLLEFDGSLWKLHKIPGNGLVRSVMIDKKNRIYIGAFEEFGYFERDRFGQLNYTSLSALLKNYKMQNDEVWNIFDDQGTIFFQSFTSYFTFKNGEVKGFRTDFSFLFFNLYQNTLYTHTFQKDFCYFDRQQNTFVPVPNNIMKSPVIKILPFDDKHALMVTISDGLYLYDGDKFTRFASEVDDVLKKAQINRAVISPNGLIVIGTILNGAVAIDKSGRKIWAISSSNVLQNNTVLGITFDRDNNIWLALDKGIAFIHQNSSFRCIQSFYPAIGAIYSVSYDPPHIYIATNQGLYRALLEHHSIRNLSIDPKIKGQVWDVSSFDGQQFCGNNEETFEVTPTRSIPVSPVKGGMCFAHGNIHGVEVLVQGTYTQLCIYKKENGKWKFSHAVEDFLHPIRYIEIDYTGTIWASHLHRGLFAIQLTPDLRKIEHINIYKSLDQQHLNTINVFSVNNRVVFTDYNLFYTFDDIRKKIVPFDELNKALGNFSNSYRICYFKGNLYWFVRPGEAALVEIKPGQIKLVDMVQYADFLHQTVDDYQNIIPISENECIFTLENGLALYNYTQKLIPQYSIQLKLKSIQISDAANKKLNFLPLEATSLPTIPYSRNNVVFSVFYPEYAQRNNVMYRFKLEGLDVVWRDPSSSPSIEYKYLPYRKYVFKAEAISESGQILSETNFAFEVQPPFYLSRPAKIIYTLAVLFLLWGIYWYVQRIIHRKKEKVRIEQEDIRRKEIEKREQQIITLEKEKLESELTLKSKELATSTITLIRKNEVLATIKEEIMQQKAALGSQYPNKYYEKIIRLLDENLSSEDDWAIFQANFDRIHENFFRHLHERYPELTPNDLRFCAYLRLNLSSKDIAHLMNISLKGVEMGRARIRKKIGLPSTKSLTEFMIEFK